MQSCRMRCAWREHVQNSVGLSIGRTEPGQPGSGGGVQGGSYLEVVLIRV